MPNVMDLGMQGSHAAGFLAHEDVYPKSSCTSSASIVISTAV